MRTWSVGFSPIAASTDRYGMILLARLFLPMKAEVGRCMLTCYLSHTGANRQLWLDDFASCFPENRN